MFVIDTFQRICCLRCPFKTNLGFFSLSTIHKNAKSFYSRNISMCKRFAYNFKQYPKVDQLPTLIAIIITILLCEWNWRRSIECTPRECTAKVPDIRQFNCNYLQLFMLLILSLRFAIALNRYLNSDFFRHRHPIYIQFSLVWAI